jgi:homoserine dehydrogenase
VVAQLIGGIEPDRSIMLRLLESGKDVVTANKALLAEHGPEVFNPGSRTGAVDRFRSLGGRRNPDYRCDRPESDRESRLSLRGILNGTSNFIVSKMEESGADYARR